MIGCAITIVDVHWNDHRQAHDVMNSHKCEDYRRILRLAFLASIEHPVQTCEGVLQLPAHLTHGAMARQRPNSLPRKAQYRRCAENAADDVL